MSSSILADSRKEMESVEELLEMLEDLLVNEFRACQLLHNLAEEQLELSKDAADALAGMIKQKEALLDELDALEEQLRVRIRVLGSLLDPNKEFTTLAEILAALPADVATRMGSLRDGSLILMDWVHGLTQVNSALAARFSAEWFQRGR